MLNDLIRRLISQGATNIPSGNPLDPNMGIPVDFPMAGTPINPGPDMTPEPTLVQNAPVPDAGPSVPAPAAQVPATQRKKRGGILGALESVFMPEPDSRWAAALRGGIWDAKANQMAYKEGVRKQGIAAQQDDLNLQMAQAKLKNLLTKGEYQIAGNNVIHFPAGGGEPRIITPPQNDTEVERLIDQWNTTQDPVLRDFLERYLLKGNSADVITQKGGEARTTAEARAASTARHRAPPRGRSGGANSGRVQIPAGAVVVE